MVPERQQTYNSPDIRLKDVWPSYGISECMILRWEEAGKLSLKRPSRRMTLVCRKDLRAIIKGASPE